MDKVLLIVSHVFIKAIERELLNEMMFTINNILSAFKKLIIHFNRVCVR